MNKDKLIRLTISALILTAAGITIFFVAQIYLTAPTGSEVIFTPQIISERFSWLLFFMPLILIFSILRALAVKKFDKEKPNKDNLNKEKLKGLKATPISDVKSMSPRGRMVGRVLLAFIVTGFIIIGIVNGGMHDVSVKADRICTECVGIG